jgi:hypothetical protein
VLTRAWLQGLSGRIDLDVAGRGAELDFIGGLLVRIGMPGRPGGRIGALLAEDARLADPMLQTALEMAQTKGKLVGQMLLALEAVTAEQLAAALERQLVERLLALLSLERGTFSVRPGIAPDRGAQDTGLNPAHFALTHLMERYGQRTLLKMKEHDTPLTGRRVKLRPTLLAAAPGLGLGHRQQPFWERLATGSDPIPDLYARSGLPPREAHAYVHAFVQMGLLLVESRG